MNYFEDLGLGPNLLTAVKRLGFTKPTQIQSLAIPLILEGRDVIGESATGSGKTLAFGSGIIEHSVPGKGIQALVLTPTRELAEQVKSSLRELSSGSRLKIAAVYGGVSISPQIRDLERSEVVVATPGRLLDHMERNTINMSKISILVLDEADRMLDMGFYEDVEKIIKSCPWERQTMFFSATISYDILDLADRFMTKPETVNAIKMVDPSKLKQVYYDVSKNRKLSLLVHLLHHENSDLVMVFCNTRRNTDFVVKNLKANKIKAIAIHGGLTQNKRTKNITRFNDGKAGVLVCTDVAARGLHIDNVSHIYNYETPGDSKDYVHRIGRTARAGEEGKVINLISDYDFKDFRRIQQEYREFNIKRQKTPYLEKIVVVKPEARRRAPRKNNRPPRRGWR
jgi:ATP-dependent RNA helicase DeaD